MKTATIKTNIHKMVDEVSDNLFLDAIYNLLKSKVKETEIVLLDDDLHEEKKRAIEEGLKDIEEGRVFSHEDVLKSLRKKYKFIK